MAYRSDAFSEELADGLKWLSRQEGPCLVHFVEGKDRTGFVCMVIEALAGASYDEMVDDYVLTYDNCYAVNLKSDPEKYRILKEMNFDAMLRYLTGDDDADIQNADYPAYAKAYLKKIGLTDTEIAALEDVVVRKD